MRDECLEIRSGLTARLPRWTHPVLRATGWHYVGDWGFPIGAFDLDDGSHPDITPWVLTCLEERNMTATFSSLDDTPRPKAHCFSACEMLAMLLVVTP